MKKIFLILVSFIMVSNYVYSKEEIILEMKIGNKLDYVEGYLDSESGDIYIDKNSFLSFIEAPEKEKKLVDIFLQNDLMLNITKLNDEKIIKFNKFQWNEDEISLEVDTIWETTEKKEARIIKNREQLDYNKKNRETEIIKRENWKLATPGILNIGFLKEDLSKTSSERIYFNYTNNLLYGNFNLSGGIDEKKSKIDYFFWQRDLKDERKIIIGNYYRNSTFNYGKHNQMTGVQVLEKNSWGSISQINSKNIIGFAPTGSTVELFVNNILKEYQIVQGGQYSFNIELNNGSNEYLIKKYGIDGSVVEEKVSLYGSEKILKKGTVDYTGSLGKFRLNRNNDGIYDIQGKYGLLNNFTIIIGATNVVNDLNEIKNFFNFGEVGSFNIPYLDLPILQEVHFSSDIKNHFAYKYRAESNLFKTNFSFFNENYKNLDTNLKNTLIRIKTSEIQVSRDLFSVNARFGFSSSTDRFNAKQDELYLNLGRGFNKIYLNTGIRKSLSTETNMKNNTSYSLGASYNFTNEIFKYIDAISLNTDIGKTNTNYGVNFGKNTNSGEFSYNFSYNYNEKFGNRYSLSINYTPGKIVGIKSGFSSNGKSINRISSGIETNIYMGATNPTLGYGNFLGDGNIVGTSFIDKNGDGKFNNDDEWISSNIKVDSTELTTKQNKEYRITGIHTYRPTQLVGELNGDDVPYNTEASLKRTIQLNPGGLMKIDLPFRLMVTVISTIDFEKDVYYEEVVDILKKLKVQFTNMVTNEKTSFNWSDDSLFITDLSVGEYEIELLYPDNAEVRVTMDKQVIKIENNENIDISFNVYKNNDKSFNIFLKN